MKTYITHNMDENKELLADLEMTRSEVVAAQKLAKEGVCLLRKANEEKEMSQVEARRLVEEKVTMVAKNEKTVWLRRQLQDLRVVLVAQKKDLEADYQKQIDDIFFYAYQCCMKNHDIANDTSIFFSDDEDDEFLGGPT